MNPVSIISIDARGLLLMITASVCYGVGSQLSKRLKNLSMYQVTFGTLFCSAIACGLAALVTEPTSFLQVPSLQSLAGMIGLGVLGSGIAYILFYFMVQKGSPEFASSVTYLVPASAIIWGYLLLMKRSIGICWLGSS